MVKYNRINLARRLAMLKEKLEFTVGNHKITLDTYVSDDKGTKRDAVLIFPGGGYSMVCHEREGEPIALAYFERGLNAFVLHYAVGAEYSYPSHLTDASFAICYLKAHAEELGINKNRIFTVGFSAGGHLSGSMAILHSEERVLRELGIEKGDNKPCGSVLAYPVVSAVCDTHRESFSYLGGKSFDELTEEEKTKYSLELNVSEDSAPVFIWHTSRDTLVPMLGSLRLAEAYYNLARPVSLHIYPYGDHGIALANEVTADGNEDWIQPLASSWVDESVEWMKTVD